MSSPALEYLDVCPQAFVQVAPSKVLKKLMITLCVLYNAKLCFFDKLQPTVAQFDTVLFAS